MKLRRWTICDAKAICESERMNRSITESIAKGLSAEEAFELAMQEEGLGTHQAKKVSLDSDLMSQSKIRGAASLPCSAFDEAVDLAESVEHPALLQGASIFESSTGVEAG